MARILAPGAVAASASLAPSWLLGLCVFVVCVLVVSFSVFICGHSHDDDDNKLPTKMPVKNPARVKNPAPAKASRGISSSSRTDTSGMYAATYYSSAAYAGCGGGHHGGHHHGGGCGGGGHHGGGGCGVGGGCGGGGCGGGCGGS